MIDEFTKRSDAVELAVSIAKNNDKKHINVLGRAMQVK
jgi:hypothetical protein